MTQLELPLPYTIDELRDFVNSVDDPVAFIERFVKVAGFPLVLNSKTEAFINKIRDQREVTTHDFDRGEGKTVALLAYLLWKLVTRPFNTHAFVGMNLAARDEASKHFRHMLASIDPRFCPRIVSQTREAIHLENGGSIRFVAATGLPSALRGHSISTLVFDNFGLLKEKLQADIAYEILPTVYANPVSQTIIV
jgi:hypothetical protein